MMARPGCEKFTAIIAEPSMKEEAWTFLNIDSAESNATTAPSLEKRTTTTTTTTNMAQNGTADSGESNKRLKMTEIDEETLNSGGQG